jgi:hypothetical protein
VQKHKVRILVYLAHDLMVPTPELVLWRVDEWCCELWSEAGRSRVRLFMGTTLVYDREVSGGPHRIATVASALEFVVRSGLPSKTPKRWRPVPE